MTGRQGLGLWTILGRFAAAWTGERALSLIRAMAATTTPYLVRRLYRSEKDQMAKALDANRSDVFIRASNRERTIREVVHTIFGPEGVEQLEGE